MRLALIADTFPPLRSSGAVQLRDLSAELATQGHTIAMFVASPGLDSLWKIEMWNGVQVVRLKSPQTKDIGYIRRTVGEFLMPFSMLRNLRKSPVANQKYEGIVWYSPSIFLGPLVQALKSESRCKSYLIIRDIFPEWAADMGLLGRGLPYLFLKSIANYQYSVADIIGIQTPGNRSYFVDWLKRANRHLEVLQNWLAAAPDRGCSISISETYLAGKMIFVYAGNMGIAQGMGILLELANLMLDRSDIGFIFVGRGSDAHKLRNDAQLRGLNNVLFFDEIEPDEIPGLYAQCHIGLVSLDPRHKSHNIPGKFLSYMQAGLPVLASVNPGNDIVNLINAENTGMVCTDNSADTLKANAEQLVDRLKDGINYTKRCKELAARLFSPETAAKQIVAALQS